MPRCHPSHRAPPAGWAPGPARPLLGRPALLPPPKKQQLVAIKVQRCHTVSRSRRGSSAGLRDCALFLLACCKKLDTARSRALEATWSRRRLLQAESAASLWRRRLERQARVCCEVVQIDIYRSPNYSVCCSSLTQCFSGGAEAGPSPQKRPRVVEARSGDMSLATAQPSPESLPPDRGRGPGASRTE